MPGIDEDKIADRSGRSDPISIWWYHMIGKVKDSSIYPKRRVDQGFQGLHDRDG